MFTEYTEDTQMELRWLIYVYYSPSTDHSLSAMKLLKSGLLSDMVTDGKLLKYYWMESYSIV